MIIDLRCFAAGRNRPHSTLSVGRTEGRLECLSSLGSCRAPLLLEIAMTASGDGSLGSHIPGDAFSISEQYLNICSNKESTLQTTYYVSYQKR